MVIAPVLDQISSFSSIGGSSSESELSSSGAVRFPRWTPSHHRVTPLFLSECNNSDRSSEVLIHIFLLP